MVHDEKVNPLPLALMLATSRASVAIADFQSVRDPAYTSRLYKVHSQLGWFYRYAHARFECHVLLSTWHVPTLCFIQVPT